MEAFGRDEFEDIGEDDDGDEEDKEDEKEMSKKNVNDGNCPSSFSFSL